MSAPRHFYFRCEDDPKHLVMVDAGLFDGANVSFWFAQNYGTASKFPRPVPVGTHDPDGLPIYYVPIPRPVLLEFIRAMRFPLLIKDMPRHVPLSLQHTLTLATWRQYLDYYGFIPPPSPPKKPKPPRREQAVAVLAEVDAVPKLAYMRRVADALVTEIKQHHPRFAKYVSGEKNDLVCQFINTFYRGADRQLTYELVVPGEPVIEPVNLAFYLGFEVSKNRSVFFFGDTIRLIDYWGSCVERAMGHAVNVNISVPLKRSSKRKTDFETHYWPAGLDFLRAGWYDVCALVIRRSGSLDISAHESFLRALEKRVDRSSDDDEGDSD